MSGTSRTTAPSTAAQDEYQQKFVWFYDAIVLAEAGLKRLGLAHRITQVLPQSLKHSEAWSDQHEVARHMRAALAQRMEVAPYDGKAHNLCLAGARS
jgi:hypothetical protein